MPPRKIRPPRSPRITWTTTVLFVAWTLAFIFVLTIMRFIVGPDTPDSEAGDLEVLCWAIQWYAISHVCAFLAWKGFRRVFLG